MKNVIIVGAGFSGMSLAYYLNQKGFSISIIDKAKGPGGMLQTIQGAHGISEAAANGFLNTAAVETFLQEIGARYIPSTQASKKRFIFRDGLKRWPLTLFETIGFIFKAVRFALKSKSEKLAGHKESVREWSERNFPKAATEFLLAPALQGIYAGDISVLSGSLILNPMFNRKKIKKLSPSSLLSAKDGMGAMMKDLEKYLIRQGVQFVYGKSWSPDISFDHLILATSAPEAASILQKLEEPGARENATLLNQVQMEPLVSVTQFYEKAPYQGRGFGVLFPRQENIRPLGVLMNDVIFSRHDKKHSETWILGGALDKDILKLEDVELLHEIQNSREKVFFDRQTPLESKITRWPKALPHYTVEHEKKISLLKPMNRVTLHGNYLGTIGLSRLLEKSKTIAENLAKGIM